jgi:hypothetical protein
MQLTLQHVRLGAIDRRHRARLRQRVLHERLCRGQQLLARAAERREVAAVFG